MRRVTQAAAIAAALTVPIAGATAAWSAVTATANTKQTITSDSWGITPEALSSSSAPNLSWTTAASVLGTPEYFRLVNTGTDAVTGSTVNVVISGTGSVPNLTFTDCSSGWTALGTCSGTQTVLGTTSGAGTVTYALAAPVLPATPGSALSVRVAPSLLNVSASYSVTLSAAVAGNQVTFPKTTTDS